MNVINLRYIVTSIIFFVFGTQPIATAASASNLLSLTVTEKLLPQTLQQHCQPDHFKYGQWVFGAHKCGLLSKLKARIASPPANYSDCCWVPMNCTAKPFSAKAFCDVVEGKHILMVGDSLMRSFYEATFNQIESEHNLFSIESSFGYGQYPDSPNKICNGKSTLVYIRNDHARVSGEHASQSKNMWKNKIHDVDILIWSKGHHVIKAQVSEEEFQAQTKETVDFLSTHVKERSKEGLNRTQLAVYFWRRLPPI